MQNVDVVCVNWGNKYSAECVMRLYAMVKRNTTKSFNMYCLTDQPEAYPDPIISIKMPDGLSGWWNKMLLFKPGILPDGEYLYFDLDVVIVDDIDCFFEFENFGITRDFVRPDNGLMEGKEYNSSIMRFTQDEQLWNFFVANQKIWKTNQERVTFFGDQNAISAYLNLRDFNNPFPDEWIWSFKCGSVRGEKPQNSKQFLGEEIPVGGKICVFHGEPNPSEVSIDWVSEHWDQKKTGTNKKGEITVSKSASHHILSINENQFRVPQHWFWDQFSDQWEPQTYNFFQRNLIKGSSFLDIGGWVGPTAFIATSLGARNVKIVEPNPLNFFHLLSSQFNNGLMKSWFLINACISDQHGHKIIGPISGIKSGSSSTNIRDQEQDGAQVISLKLQDILSGEEDLSLIKIDIEGAEELIVSDLALFADYDAAIWLSLHPPHFQNKELFLQKLSALESTFVFVDGDNAPLASDIISHQVMSDEQRPAWGTDWGNFFEIGLLPRKHFQMKSKAYSRFGSTPMSSAQAAA